MVFGEIGPNLDPVLSLVEMGPKVGPGPVLVLSMKAELAVGLILIFKLVQLQIVKTVIILNGVYGQNVPKNVD